MTIAAAHKPVTLETLQACLEFVAELVEYRPSAIPIFERLEAEIKAMQEGPAARAKALAARRRVA